MKTRNRLMVAYAAVLCAINGVARAEKRPNIILIMADDVSWECFSCYGAEDYKTPNIDRLAAQGVRFEHCYSAPLCTPSRVMIMSGKYNFRNYTHFTYMNPAEKTFGNLLQDAGYKTAMAGKWQLNGIDAKMPGWDDHSRPFKAGFDEYCLWQLTRSKKEGERFWNPAIEHNGTLTTSKDNKGKYGPDIFNDFVCDFIDRNHEQPFFVYYPMVLVHAPFVPTPDSGGPSAKGTKKEHFQAMMAYMDKLVGKVVDRVDSLGIADNTLILFTADNGTHTSITSQWNGQQIKGGKGSMTDMGTHVPLIARWKGRTRQGKSCQDLVDFTDVYPTLAEVAGLALTEDDPSDGRSFLPQVFGKQQDPRDWVLCHYQPYLKKKTPGQFVRTTDYKLYRDGRFYQPNQDLKEEHDLAESLQGEKMIDAYKQLKSVIEKMPPAPGRSLKDRPVYPEWSF